MMKREPKDGELWSAHSRSRHCRHGLYFIKRHRDGRLYAEDTYRGSSGSADFFFINQPPSDFEFVIDLNNARETNRDEFDIYADDDRAYIPIGGMRERFFVLNGAEPDHQRAVEQLERKIEEAEFEISTAQQNLRKYHADLRVERRLADIIRERAYDEGEPLPTAEKAVSSERSGE